MRVLVTGGLGFIGGHLANHLMREGNDVVIFDDHSNTCFAPSAFLYGTPRIIRGSVLDESALRAACEDAELVYHLAVGHLLQSLEDPLTVHRINAEGTLNVCEACRRYDLKLVYISSCEVYGNTTQYPTPETAPTYPTTIYGSSKLCGEHYTRVYRLYGIPSVIVRLFNTYGHRPGGRYLDVITKLISTIKRGLRGEAGQICYIEGDGEQTRDFTYIDDAVEGILLASKLENAVINIGSGVETSINELRKLLAQMFKYFMWMQAPDRPYQNRRMWADISKAKKLLNYEPKVKLEEGVRRVAHQIGMP